MWLRHAEHELAWTADGRGLIEADGHRHPVDAQWALWLPAGEAHRVHVDDGSLVLSLRFAAADHDGWVDVATPVLRTDVLDRLVRSALQEGAGSAEARTRSHARVHTLVGVLLRDEGRAPVPLVGPARAVALALLRDPSRPESLVEWSCAVHVSPKTLQRAFVAETGMPFRRWRTKVRLAAAVTFLRAGDSVAVTSARVGFRSQSAFAAACRTELGMTPGEVRAAAVAPTIFGGASARG
ncbi:helix-turn-helix domain-containing protein [Knoellia koreensis]|uniref:AraC family transcriptional regulator n=1 Tax=Knoellia koreensis TaxID=2730921 RepID=A0A849HQK1_9MICO|nr:AraC family transcriptional regulator [Knoellia sp. DB2414S]NNM46867.1 AraC family transcriptional regulator [Knoellia sp. DB2414S]